MEVDTLIDFTGVPVIDNHCHPLDPDKATLEPETLAREFYHGMGDIPEDDITRGSLGATPELSHHFSNLGVVHTVVCQLSELFDCPAELAAVAFERNRRTADGLTGYARLLYEDAGIVGTVLDTGLPQGDPVLDLMPGRVMRLFQMGPAISRLLEHAQSYQELLRDYQEALDRAVRVGGFVGVKAHLAEEVGFGVEPASRPEAEAVFFEAKAGESEAHKRLYVAIFTATLLQCQDLGVPVHLHSGLTGGLWNGPISNADPFLLAPFIRQPAFRQSKIVLLHAGYPWIQHASALAHALPQIWVDIGWVTPWISLRIVECYRELVAMAPLSKLMIGSGGHGTPEIAWLAAKVAKTALAEVFEDAVRLGFMVARQAEQAGRMILQDNAARLYDLEPCGS
jgi:predicted TIM-barrel fold metal-dependent hydrolase